MITKEFHATEADIRAELDRLLSRPAFAASHRSSEFLRYVVDQALSGHADQIKERSIAMAIFNRGTEYEPGADSIVRVNAVEVRRRLKQHYASCPESKLRIDLPQGGYVPKFEAGEAIPPMTTRHRWLWPALIGLLSVAAVLVWAVARSRPTDDLDELWRPMASSKSVVMIGLPSPVVFEVRDGPPAAPVPPKDVIEISNYYVGTGAAYGAAQVAAMLAARGGRFMVKVGHDVSYEDLKNQPAVFLGAHSSPWTMEFSGKLRFQFLASPSDSGVVDTAKPGQRWMRRTSLNPTDVTEDYAIVARIFDRGTGNPILLIAGCGARGTHAASEFVSSKEAFKSFTSVAPRDWPRRDFEVVLHAEVHGAVPGKPHLVAWHVW